MKPDTTAIRARADAASQGPWSTGECHSVVAPPDSWDASPCIAQCFTETAYQGISAEQAGKNAAFIAAARTDVPALCNEIAELRKLLHEARDLAGLAVTELKATGDWEALHPEEQAEYDFSPLERWEAERKAGGS